MDSLNAWTLTGYGGSVQFKDATKTDGIGKVVKTDLLKGKIKVQTDDGAEWIQGSRVATLDDFLI